MVIEKSNLYDWLYFYEYVYPQIPLQKSNAQKWYVDTGDII